MNTNPQAAMSLLALSHSPVEQALYEALRAATGGAGSSSVGNLNLRRLLELTGLGSYTTLRRARAGLVANGRASRVSRVPRGSRARRG